VAETKAERAARKERIALELNILPSGEYLISVEKVAAHYGQTPFHLYAPAGEN
jgi:hypothetical protein